VVKLNKKNFVGSKILILIYSRVGNFIRDVKDNISFCKHPIISMIKFSLFRSPWRIKTKDGKEVIINSKDVLFRERFKFLHSDSYESHYVIKKDKKNEVILRIPLSDNGDIYRAFVNEDYSWLPVKDQIVIDVGAGVGDTALLFALWGAKKVYAYEPFPSRFESAVKNIVLNNYQDVIELHNSGIGIRSQVLVDSDFNPTNSSSLSNHISKENGFKLDILDLNTIVKFANSNNIIMKMDCEGCEYSALLDVSCDILKNFSHIQLEYHYGYKDIEKKLKNCGFLVSHTKPKLMKDRDIGSTTIIYGYLFAKRK
jgi:FkbM family methyltransferase